MFYNSIKFEPIKLDQILKGANLNSKDVILVEKEKDIRPKNEDLNVANNEVNNIRDLIYTIRGKQVMLDNDVARLYQYTTKRINETVRRNIERFPENFCFQLTEDEVLNLRSQIATSSLGKDNYGGRRYLPYVLMDKFMMHIA